ncbi:MAG TPA: hypothetical protein VFW96_23925 [Thermomicrobiales bacterium]|nr:hypothetical protein [Thermomicrobiales bacterium]
MVADLERLVEPATRGESASPLRWTSKSLCTLAAALHAARYRRQGHRKMREGRSHPDRDAQFAHLNAAAEAALVALRCSRWNDTIAPRAAQVETVVC